MRYWDASALVPLFVRQDRTSAMRALLRTDRLVVTWWCTSTECDSAVSRLERDGLLAPTTASAAFAKIARRAAQWDEVQPRPEIRTLARRLLRSHVLRAADAMQLSAALTACEHRPESLEFVCLDDRLRSAADREGFPVLPAAGGSVSD